MKKVVAICLLLSLYANASEKLLLVTHNLPPYGAFVTDKEVHQVSEENFKGIAVDRLRCVLNKMPFEYEIKVVPWMRAQKLVESNQATAFFAASQNKIRDSYATITLPIADQIWTWYKLKSNSLSPTSKEFKKLGTVGGFLGANMTQWLENHDYNLELTARAPDILFEALLARRVDAILANNLVKDTLPNATKAKLEGIPHSNRPLGVYFNNQFLSKYPSFLATFNNNIKKCLPSSALNPPAA